MIFIRVSIPWLWNLFLESILILNFVITYVSQIFFFRNRWYTGPKIYFFAPTDVPGR